MTEIFVDVPLLGHMSNQVASVGARTAAPEPSGAGACGSSSVAQKLRKFGDARTQAFARVLANVSTLGTGMLETANDFSQTDEEIIAMIETLDV